MKNEVLKQEVVTGVNDALSQELCKRMLNDVEHELYDAPGGATYLMVRLTPGQMSLFNLLEYGSQSSTSYEEFQQYTCSIPMGTYVGLVTALKKYM